MSPDRTRGSGALRPQGRRGRAGRIAGLVAGLVAGLCLASGVASPAGAVEPDDALCLAEIHRQEARLGIPPGLLVAIALVESGRPATSGQSRPWPWTLNIEGRGRFHADRASARQALMTAVAAGRRQIDVGCMQVNLQSHPAAFASPGEALDPALNVAYAASFLVSLYQESGSWSQATAWYHSRTPSLGMAYRQRVEAAHARVTENPPALLAAPGEQLADLAGAYESYRQRRASRDDALAGAVAASGGGDGGGGDSSARPHEAAAILLALQESRRTRAVVREARRGGRR